MTETAPPQDAKLDPETLEIRARPPRAVRLKRGAIIAIAACLSVSLIAVTWMALKPRLFHRGENQQELSQPDVRPTSDGLAAAPATYGDVPRLGPPLPGDLGKPILERQQQLVTAADTGDPQLQQAEEAERERRIAEWKAARESGVIVWQRIIMPDGRSLRIDNVPATDPSGYAGLAGKVDFHSWQLLKGVVLSTLLGVGSDLAFSGQSDLVQAIRMSTQDHVARAGDQITRANLGIQPTITIPPGAPVRLVVHKDLVFAPAGQEG